MSRTLYSPWIRTTTLDDKKQDCLDYINHYGAYISAYAWESVLKHRKGPSNGRGFVVVDISTEREKGSSQEGETRMAFIPTTQFVDHGWIVKTPNLLNLVKTYDPDNSYVCLFTDGFDYTESGQELPVLLLGLDQQTKRQIEAILAKTGRLNEIAQESSKSSETSASITATESSTKKDKGKEVDRVIIDDGTPKCAACGRKEAKLLVCGRCRQNKATRPAKYCSRECQQKDWPEHKQVCK